MRRAFFIYIAIAFLFRGLLGDAMAVTMAYSALTAISPGCHNMVQSKKVEIEKVKPASPAQKADCQLCCAIAAPAPNELLVRPSVYPGLQIDSIANFSSTTVQPAFKPPIL